MVLVDVVVMVFTTDEGVVVETATVMVGAMEVWVRFWAGAATAGAVAVGPADAMILVSVDELGGGGGTLACVGVDTSAGVTAGSLT